MSRSIKLFVFSATMILITSFLVGTSDQDDEIAGYLDSFLVDYSEAFGIVKERFGDDRENIPRHILEIIDDLKGRNSEIVTEARRLREEAYDMEYDQYRLDNEEKDLDYKEKVLQNDMADDLAKSSEWQSEKQLYDIEASTHLARKYAIINEQEKLEWNKKASQLNAWSARLQYEQDRGQKVADDINIRKSDIEKKRQSFRERRDAHLGQVRHLNLKIDDFRRQCFAASHWSLVLAELVSVWSESGREAGAGMAGSKFYEEVANLVGPVAITQLGFKTIGGGVGHVLTVLDIAKIVSNEHDREIQRRLLIIGNYADAIASLKTKGHLRQGDRRYEALRHMMRISGQRMPTTATEFNTQALFSVTTLANSLAGVATHYLGGATARSGKARIISAFKADKRFWASNGFLRGVIKGSNDILSGKLATINIKTSSDLVAHQRERAKAHGR